MQRRHFIGTISLGLVINADANDPAHSDELEESKAGYYKDDFVIVRNRRSGGQVLYKERLLAQINYPLHFDTTSVAFSPNAQFFACGIVNEWRKTAYGFSNRSAGLQIYGLAEGLWSLRKTLMLKQDFPDNYARIIEVGAVSNSGRKLLVKFGKGINYKNERLVIHEWEVWDDSGKLLQQGLTI